MFRAELIPWSISFAAGLMGMAQQFKPTLLFTLFFFVSFTSQPGKRKQSHSFHVVLLLPELWSVLGRLERCSSPAGELLQQSPGHLI